jgi:hypothetical protein
MVKEICPECGVAHKPAHPLAVFCSAEHKRAWNNRMLKRGAPLMLELLAWRKSRHLKGDPIGRIAFTDLCLALDKMIAEDKAAGRPEPTDLLKRRMRRQGLGGLLKAEPKAKATKAAEQQKEAA